jgi:Family of unknown function (DUF5996)
VTDVGLQALPYGDWKQTKQTLHLYAQIVGKVKLATTAPRNHWWNVALHLDARGLTTRRLTRGGTSFDLSFDFVDHRLVLRTDDGAGSSFPLEDGLSVAAFDASLHELLREHGLDVEIREQPYRIAVETPFPADEEHASYQREYVERFWHTLAWVDGVLDEFSGWFCGKQSPVHLFWHGLDLAYSRFSGRRAPLPEDVDPVTREAYSHEVVSFGFWAGDDNIPDASFYSYTAPEPPGLRDRALYPADARWLEQPTGSLALLHYDVIRTAPDPRTRLLAFLQSAYEAGAEAAGWDADDLASSACPPPRELQQLRLR